MKLKQKLILKKERIAALSNQDMNNTKGGKAIFNNGSTRNDFTCTWCTTVTSRALTTCGGNTNTGVPTNK